MNKAESWLARALVAGACQYEVLAITTGRLPTLSSLMWACPPRYRLAIWGGVALIATDHFFWRRLS